MKILHFYKTSWPNSIGGVEQVILQIAKGATRLDVQTNILSLSTNSSETKIEMDGYTIHQIPQNFHIASTGFSIAAFSRFKQLAKKADLIHYHFPWPFMDLVHFATRSQKPTLVTYHSDIIRQKYLLKLYRPLQQRFLASVDAIVATSQNYLATSAVIQKFKHKTHVIPIGLDQSTYAEPPCDRLTFWQEKLGPKFFLFIGVIRYYKGLEFLLEAALGTNYPIVIVGTGPLEQTLRTKAKQLSLSNIYFLGSLPEEDKVALLTLCYAVVSPAHLRSEAFGISLLEGAMYGKPMICCEIGTGTTFINIKDETGLVVPPGDPIAMRNAMRYLWEHPEQATEMGRKAKARYWKYFKADQMVDAYVKLYRALAEK